MATIERQPAIMACVAELQHGRYVIKEGWNPNYVETSRGHVSRTSLIGALIQEVEPAVWMLDDGTGQILLRSFDDKKPTATVGQVVHVIGRPREYGGQRFVNYEIIHPVKPGWLKYRKQELEMLGGAVIAAPVDDSRPSPEALEAAPIASESSSENLFEKVLKAIRAEDEANGGQGGETDAIIARANIKEAEHILKSLMEEGEVFEIKPGKIKVLE